MSAGGSGSPSISGAPPQDAEQGSVSAEREPLASSPCIDEPVGPPKHAWRAVPAEHGLAFVAEPVEKPEPRGAGGPAASTSSGKTGTGWPGSPEREVESAAIEPPAPRSDVASEVDVSSSPHDSGPEADLPQASRASSLGRWSDVRLAATSVGILLLATLTAYLLNAAQPTVYGAEADVLFEVSGSAQEGERDLATQEVLLSSRGVLAPVAEQFDVPLRELERSQNVELIAGSEILRLQVRNEDPTLAVRLAQSIAVTYVDSVSPGVTEGGAEQQRRIREEITNLSVTAAAGRARLDAIATARGSAGGAGAVTQEERELQLEGAALADRIETLQDRLAQMLIEQEAASRARILTDAYLLDDPVAPKPARGVAAGLMLGLVVVGGLVALVIRQRSLPRSA